MVSVAKAKGVAAGEIIKPGWLSQGKAATVQQLMEMKAHSPPSSAHPPGHPQGTHLPSAAHPTHHPSAAALSHHPMMNRHHPTDSEEKRLQIKLARAMNSMNHHLARAKNYRLPSAAHPTHHLSAAAHSHHSMMNHLQIELACAMNSMNHHPPTNSEAKSLQIELARAKNYRRKSERRMQLLE